MRLIFIGAVEGSYKALKAILESGGNVVRIFTLLPEFARRHSDFADLTPLAQAYAVPITYVNNINDEIELIREESADYLLVLGWSQLLLPPLLETTKHGVIGFHPALLPENRGRAAQPWVILRGMKQTGATLFFIDSGMDSGDIVSQHVIDVATDETARSLYDKVTDTLAEMMRELTPALMGNQPLPRTPQDHRRATYTAKRTKRDGHINWENSAETIWTLIRAVGEPYPGAFTFYKGREVVIWSAERVERSDYIGVPGQILRPDGTGVLIQCGQGFLRLLEVQEKGKERQLAADYFTRVHDVLGIDWLKVAKRLDLIS